ncbi:MAG: D-alanyl-D-alanine carboxypeptidase family protein [Oscillospiraceae bacterium]|nr:D-alanyl-D-alanine carboxypeptidase family protein [Oscillospiraceae bacterium]
MNISAGNTGKKRRIRYDRIIIAVLVLVIICASIIFIRIGKKSSQKDKPVTDTKTSGSLSTKNGKIEFEKIFLNKDDIYKGTLLLIDDDHIYKKQDSFDTTLANLDDMKSTYFKLKSLDLKMESLTAKCFSSMMSGFYSEKSKNDIMVLNAYISEDHQNIMYNQALENSKKICKGGYSEHQSGLAFDLGIYPDKEEGTLFTSTGDYTWITENCMKYGFISRYPGSRYSESCDKEQDNHFRYVGIPHAYYMTENNLTLEEYLNELKKYSFGEKTLSFSCYSKSYEIYYIKAAKDVNDVYVPCVNPYTISGNNEDGFIITVEK